MFKLFNKNKPRSYKECILNHTYWPGITVFYMNNNNIYKGKVHKVHCKIDICEESLSKYIEYEIIQESGLGIPMYIREENVFPCIPSLINNLLLNFNKDRSSEGEIYKLWKTTEQTKYRR